jgi:hypothetical protein
MKHERVLAVVRSIRMNQEYRKLNDLMNESLYSNSTPNSFGRGGIRRFAPMTRLSLNVVRNMIGAVTSKIASKSKPKVTFLTEEGNYEQREQAHNLEKFVGGVFYQASLYPELPECFRDAAKYGTTFLKAVEDEGRCGLERVNPKHIVVDDAEGEDLKPRNMYQRRYFDRLVLKELWAKDDEKLAQLIEDCPRDSDDVEAGYQTTADQVLVTEAWHLGEGKKVPGRHCIVIEGATLLDEPWKDPFPFAVMRWSRETDSFFGMGLAEELRGIQAEINKLLQQIQKGHHLIAGHWLVQQGTTLTSQINNDLAAIVKYTGTPPQYQAPNIIAPEVYNHLWQLYAKAFEISGVSQLQATGLKPAGLDSGEAQRVYNDTQSERFLEVGQAFEEFVVEAARQVVRCAKRIGGSYKVRAVEDNGLSPVIDWSEITLPEDDYVIRIQPSSMLPTTVAGKTAWVEMYAKDGMIPSDELMDLVADPDTAAYRKRKNAPKRIIERNIAHMLKTGEPVAPEPADNHELALKLTNESYHEARLDGVPEPKLQLLRDYMAVTQSYLPKPAPPAPPLGDPMMGAPPPPMDPMGMGPPPPPMPPMPPMDPAMPVAA